MKNLNKFLFLIIFFSTLIIFNKTSQVTAVSNNIYNVLVINTYNSNSEWEKFILDGIKSKLSPENQIHLEVEYLDIRKRNDKEYLDSFLNFLEVKYENLNINAILAIDDEALDLVKDNLFNNSSIFYKRPIIFAGINKPLIFSEDEEKYITGVAEVENNIELINIITKLHSNVDEINVILDNAVYSEIIKKSLPKRKDFFDKPLNINLIQATYIEDILKSLSKINKENQANILIGDFISETEDITYSPKETIDKINSVISTPIYTKSQPYISNGALGGIVNWGQEIGNTVGEIIINLRNGLSPYDIPIVYNPFEKIVFNYKLLDRYKINPLLLPENTIYINRGLFDFLLPKTIRMLCWFIIVTFVLFIILLIYKFLNNRKEYIKSKELLLQVQASEKLKTEFITTVSHELRTPLNIIINASKLISNRIEDDIIDKQYIASKLKFINKNSYRLLRIINNVIDLSKLGTGYITPNLEMQNIVEVIESTVMLTVDFAQNHGIQVVFDTTEEEIYTAIDSIKIERVLLNLISNAIKFTPPGGSIEVSISQSNNDIIINIKDTGIGIPENLIDTIFEKFTQVDSSLTREKEGSGLGLSIARGLIDIHNGSITVTSKEGIGSVFVITLPIVKLSHNNVSHHSSNNFIKQNVELELSDIDDLD